MKCILCCCSITFSKNASELACLHAFGCLHGPKQVMSRPAMCLACNGSHFLAHNAHFSPEKCQPADSPSSTKQPFTMHSLCVHFTLFCFEFIFLLPFPASLCLCFCPGFTCTLLFCSESPCVHFAFTFICMCFCL